MYLSKPDADDRALLKSSHLAVVGFSLWMAGFASMLFGIGVDLSFIYNMTGIFTGPGLPPLILTFFSSRQGALAAGASIWSELHWTIDTDDTANLLLTAVGFVSGVIAWLTLAHKFSGEVTIASVGLIDPCLYGCLTGIAASAFVTGIISLVRPAN